MSKEEQTKTSYKKFILWFWVLVGSPFVIGAACVWFAAMGWFGPLPSFEELENPKSNLASQIISADGKEIGKYFIENRTHVDYEDLSPYLVQALVSTEDERYFEHSGIDLRALFRVVLGVLTGDSNKGGGSTITQQLAKMLFSDPPKSKFERVQQKFKEWVISVQLEKRYTKEEMIAMYLNKFDFLNLAVGIQSAAKIYFNTTPDKLSLEQAAMLVGMAKNPALYNPRRRPELTEKRRNVVFRQMKRNKVLTAEEVDSLRQIPLKLEFQRADHNEGLAPYFREYLRKYMREWIANNPKADSTYYNLYTDGLKIYTTIDTRLQHYAEQAVEAHLTELQKDFYSHWKGVKNAPFSEDLLPSDIKRIMTQAMKRTDRYRALKKREASEAEIQKAFSTPVEMTLFSWSGEKDTVLSPMDSIRYYKFLLQTGFMSMEPQTGFVKAWVGGINHKYLKYDHVKDGGRQVGSTFKPFVYATAIDQKKYSPCYQVPNVKVTFEKEKWGLPEDWTPKNSGDSYGGMLTLKSALANSVNTVTARLMKQVGPSQVVRLAELMGLDVSDIPAVPSICLGTPDVSVFEMVGAYSTFANRGIYTQPVMVTRITDKNGIVLYEYQPETREVLSEEVAYSMINLLQGVTEPGGSGYRLRFKYNFSNAIAGKTGTTQNHSDGWFIGMVPNLVSGVWVGCEDRSVHFRTITLGQGANMALPIWAEFMKRAYNDPTLTISKDDFRAPRQGMSIELDCDTYNQGQLNRNFGDFGDHPEF